GGGAFAPREGGDRNGRVVLDEAAAAQTVDRLGAGVELKDRRRARADIDPALTRAVRDDLVGAQMGGAGADVQAARKVVAGIGDRDERVPHRAVAQLEVEPAGDPAG